MIIQLLLMPIFALINMLLGFLPSIPALPDWITSLITLIGYGLIIVPADVWIATISVVSFWWFALIGWAVIEWIYKKIPGVS